MQISLDAAQEKLLPITDFSGRAIGLWEEVVSYQYNPVREMESIEWAGGYLTDPDDRTLIAHYVARIDRVKDFYLLLRAHGLGARHWPVDDDSLLPVQHDFVDMFITAMEDMGRDLKTFSEDKPHLRVKIVRQLLRYLAAFGGRIPTLWVAYGTAYW